MPNQLALEDLARMQPEEVAEAERTGRLDELLHRQPTADTDADLDPQGQLDASALRRMTPEAVAKVFEDGRLANLLGGGRVATAEPVSDEGAAA